MLPDVFSRLLWALGLSAGGVILYVLANRWLLMRANGKAVRMAGRNRPAILYFTTPDCAPCKTVQRPAIETLRSQLGDRIEVVEIDASMDPELASQWGVLSVPTTYILDRQGNARFVNHGVAPAQKLRSQIQGLI